MYRLKDTINSWERKDEKKYLIEPICIGTKTLSKIATDHAGLNQEDVAIVSGKWEHKDDVYIMFGQDDWNEKGKEIDEAMEDDSEEEDDDDEWGDLDNEIEMGLTTDKSSRARSQSNEERDSKKQKTS